MMKQRLNHYHTRDASATLGMTGWGLKTSLAALLCAFTHTAHAQEDRGFNVYQFPPNMIPRIDGKADDWASFPKEYIVGADQLRDDSGHYPKADSTNLDVKVRVAWDVGLDYRIDI